MPIIGLGTNIFGYVVKESVSYGPSYRFVFCDESGCIFPYEVDNYLILSIQPHFYSTYVSTETKSIIIVNSDNTLWTIGGCHFSKTHIIDLTSIGNSGLSITFKSFIKEDKFGLESHLFHPISYLNLEDSPLLINIYQSKIISNTYYLFSMLSFHFLVDLKEEEFENPDNFTYKLVDKDGNLIYSWDKNNQIKCIWYREDGTYTIYSLSECDCNCYYYEHRDKYDISDYRKVNILHINKNYENLTITDHKKEIVEASKKNIGLRSISDSHPESEELYDDEIYVSDEEHEEYKNWKKRKCFTERTILAKLDDIKSLCCKLGYHDHSSIELRYQGLFCDNNYLVAIYNCGFLTFDQDNLLSINDFSNLVPINKWDFDDYAFEPRITDCKYGNGFVGFQLMKYYDGDYPPDEDCNYNKYIGNYRIHDVYGNYIGELNGNLLVSPIIGINRSKFYGVISESDFSIIIPPIFKDIIPLDRYIKKVKISEVESTSVSSQNNPTDDNSDEDTYLYKYYTWDEEYGVIEDKTLYIVSQEIGLEGRTLYGIFENGKEFVFLGNNDIRKVSGQYLLTKCSNQSLYTLYFHSGKILYNNVKDVEVVNIYNIKNHGSSWGIQNSKIEKSFSYSKVYFENGFRIIKDDSCVIDEVLLDSIPLLYSQDDVIFKSRLLQGNLVLYSITNGLILSNYESENIVEIEDAFSIVINKDKKYNSFSYISHIIKYGDEFTSDVKQKINKDLWGYSNDPELFLNYSSNEAVLGKIDGRYRILRDHKQQNDIDKSLLAEDNIISKGIKNIKKSLKKNTIDPSLIVNDVSFVGRKNELKVNELVLRIKFANEKVGYYSSKKGWIIQPEMVEYYKQYDNYVIFNNHIVRKNGTEYSFESKLKHISSLGQNTAYYNSSEDLYIIIDSDGSVLKNLYRKDDDNLVNNRLEDFYEYQFVLNIKNKTLTIIGNPNYRYHDSYCPEPNEWTDEDSWDAMTDGQYGDYPGSGWDPEQFGY